MISIIFSLILSFLLFTFGHIDTIPSLSYIFGGISIIILLILPLMNIFGYQLLQKASHSTTPLLIHYYRKDHIIRSMNVYFFCFALFTLFLAIAYQAFNIPLKSLIIGWVILFGIFLDLLRHYIKHSLHYLDPETIMKRIEHAARESIQNDQIENLWDSVDAFSEIGIKAIDSNSTSIANKMLDDLQITVKNYLQSEKSISHTTRKRLKDITGGDEISYTLVYVLQRLELLFEKAIRNHIETICSQIIILTGKIIYSAAQFDLSLTNYPLHFFGKFVEQAQKHNMNDVAVKGTITLLEVAKSIVNDIDIKYAELQPPFNAIIGILENVQKTTFKRDKNIDIKILREPFRELQELFQSEKLANHPDTPAILGNIRRVLTDFDALEMVMKSMPSLPTE